MRIIFGPSALGSVKDALNNLEKMHDLGLRSCEIPFTYGVYIKEEKDIIAIQKKAKELDIKLSIHAPYYINLNSKEKQKVFASKKRILDCCHTGHLLGAKNIVFHAGFYSKMSPEEAYENIKKQVTELQDTIKKRGYDVKLCPEIMGKKNVFGSIDEISRLAKETNCSFCIDFAHILARYNKHMFSELIEKFPQKDWHCHFSGIEYTIEKGERKHKQTETEEWENLLKNLKELDKDISISSEAPEPVKDAKTGLETYKKRFS